MAFRKTSSGTFTGRVETNFESGALSGEFVVCFCDEVGGGGFYARGYWEKAPVAAGGKDGGIRLSCVSPFLRKDLGMWEMVSGELVGSTIMSNSQINQQGILTPVPLPHIHPLSFISK